MTREQLQQWAETPVPFDHLVWSGVGISVADVKSAVRELLDETRLRADREISDEEFYGLAGNKEPR